MAGRSLRILTVGSSDSSGGAGIQGDVKAATSMGAFGSTVVVGVTAQNTLGVVARHSVPIEVIAAQWRAVLDDIGTDAVKIGTTWSAEIIEWLGGEIRTLDVPVVLDPVIFTAAGARLSDQGAIDALRRTLLSAATVVTPNVSEARLLGNVGDDTEIGVVAEAMVAAGARAVVITDALPEGGDWLFDGHRHIAIPGRRHRTGCDHGAGCAHSAVLAVLLGSGSGLSEAAHLTQRIVSRAVGVGRQDIGSGRHPVDVAQALRDGAE
jgi:hydroxymethylpyrimidine/phosphomethylpyrimidine kinase